MSSFITPASDITDVDVKQFIAASDGRLSLWTTAVDNEITAIGYSLGLTDDTIADTLHPIVKEYAVAYFCYMVFRDNVGAVNIDTPDTEKYMRKFEMYASECNRLKKRCTKQLMYAGTDDDQASDIDRVPVNILVR